MYGQLPEVTIGDQTVRGVTIRVPNPPKTAIIGLPTNDQVIERMDAQKSIRRNLGRRRSQTDYMPNTQADLALFNKIRIDKEGPEFDDSEAAVAIQKLLYLEVLSCERVGDQYRIAMKTPFGEVTHTLNIPLQRDLQRYRRNVVTSIDLPHNMEEIRTRSGPSCDLYDSISASTEGYAEGTTVPPHHKSAAVVEVVNALEELDPVIDPNF